MWAKASPNIAFLKYWGKLPATRDEDRNLATNPSLSLTLSKAETRTCVERLPDKASTVFTLNNAPASEKDTHKVSQHLARVTTSLGLPAGAFRVESRNNFPAGAGIASSASAFAALTLAALGEILGEQEALRYLNEKNSALSELARRGSGSASRSVSGPFMKWDGRAAQTVASEWRLRDTILVLSSKHKAVPSSDGHELAQSSPLFAKRLTGVPERLARIEACIRDRDLGRLGPILEEEAIELHEIARTGRESVEYLLPETKAVLAHLKTIAGRDFWFTLDAGPNVHLISERPLTADAEKILSKLGISASIWEDEAGMGPSLLGSKG